MLTGGTVGAGPDATSALSAAGRSVLQQPASSSVEKRTIAIEAVLGAMNEYGSRKQVAAIVSR